MKEKKDAEKVEPQCDHENWSVKGHNRIGFCTCDDCGREINLAKAFNALKDRMVAVLSSAVRIDLIQNQDGLWEKAK